MTFRMLVKGAETDVERVVALRTYPIRSNFIRGSWLTASGFMGHAEVSTLIFRDGVQPTTTAGYGITSNPHP